MADEDLTMQAVRELQKDAERAKDRSRTLGSTGWKRRIATTNRVYLHNSIIGNIQANKRITKNMKKSYVNHDDSSKSTLSRVNYKGDKHDNNMHAADEMLKTSSYENYKSKLNGENSSKNTNFKTQNRNRFDVPAFTLQKRKVKKNKIIESEDSEQMCSEGMELSDDSITKEEIERQMKEEDESDIYTKRKKKNKRKNSEIEKYVRYKRLQNQILSDDGDGKVTSDEKMMEVSHTVSKMEMDSRQLKHSTSENDNGSNWNLNDHKNIKDSGNEISTNSYLHRIDKRRSYKVKSKRTSDDLDSVENLCNKKLKTKNEKFDLSFLSKRSHKRKYLSSSSDSYEESYICKKVKRKQLLEKSKVVQEKGDKVSTSDQEMFIPVNIHKKLKMSHDSFQAVSDSESDWEEKIVYPPPKKVSSTDNDEEMVPRSRRYPNYNLYCKRIKNTSGGETTYKHKDDDDGMKSLPLAISKNVTITEDAYSSHLVISKNRSKISRNSRLFNIAVNGLNKKKSEKACQQAKTIEVDFSCRLELDEKNSTLIKPYSKRKFHGEKDNSSS